MTNPTSQQGFTLIEFVCIIILLGILSVSVSIKSPGSSLSVSAQASQVAYDLRYTQALAMSKDIRYRLVVTSSTSYQIVNDSGIAILNAAGETTTTLKNGVSFGALSNLPNNLVAFDGRGTPYTTLDTPGTALASTATIPVVGGGVTKTISIDPQTGRVTLS